jgi:acetylornithine deacetylase/succinyl-diaminopimelate desuccinylase-like protein
MRALFCLASALALTAIPCGTAAQPAPDPHTALARSILEEIVEINTTNSVRGDNTVAARALARRFLDAGFPEEDVHVLVPSDAPTKGNLVVRYRGRDTGRGALLLLAHIDVVEALPEDWSPDLNPFELTERDGYFYGRGVLDDKDEAAIYTANLIRMRQEGFVPDRDIIVALTADEESGPRNGVQFLLQEYRELIDAEYALNEGGGGMSEEGRRISNNVQAAEKKFLNFDFTVRNPGGHSSLPVPKNAIYDLSQALLAVQSHEFPVMLNEVTRAFFSGTADLVGGEVGEAMRRIVANPADPGAAGVLRGDTNYDSRLRTTCVATMLDGGHATNALPQLAHANVNCRILPDHDPADVHRVMSTGATDGLYLRREGIPVYGVSGIFVDGDDNRMHGKDERVRVQSFYEGQEFLYRLVKALSGGGVA